MLSRSEVDRIERYEALESERLNNLKSERQLIRTAIEQEISWCRSNEFVKAVGCTKEYKRGFINGLKQSLALIQKVKEVIHEKT